MNKQEEKEVMKAAFREAAREYLDEAVTTFGWWSLRAIGGVVVIGLTYFLLTMLGWHKP
jgi:hypothetical protein